MSTQQLSWNAFAGNIARRLFSMRNPHTGFYVALDQQSLEARTIEVLQHFGKSIHSALTVTTEQKFAQTRAENVHFMGLPASGTPLVVNT